MKELITTQLIEEYQKKLDEIKKEIRETPMGNYYSQLLGHERMCVQFITSLQSKQSEERQNILDAVTGGRTIIDYNPHHKISEAVFKYKTPEDYFNQTFKQEQK